MDEGRRQAYLAALGVPLWSARHDLSGAAHSPSLVFVPFLDESPGGSADCRGWRRYRGAFQRRLRRLTSAPAVPPREPAARSATPPSTIAAEATAASTSAPTATASALRFSLRVQALAPGWLGITMLGDVPDHSKQEYKLLSALGHALGAAPDFSGSVSVLSWPRNANPGMDHSEAAAIEWLSHALKVPEGWRCVVLGEAMSVQVRAALPASIVMVAGPSLNALLTTPLTKKTLWMALHV
jgi:hypothetical protein